MFVTFLTNSTPPHVAICQEMFFYDTWVEIRYSQKQWPHFECHPSQKIQCLQHVSSYIRDPLSRSSDNRSAWKQNDLRYGLFNWMIMLCLITLILTCFVFKKQIGLITNLACPHALHVYLWRSSYFLLPMGAWRRGWCINGACINVIHFTSAITAREIKQDLLAVSTHLVSFDISITPDPGAIRLQTAVTHICSNIYITRIILTNEKQEI